MIPCVRCNEPGSSEVFTEEDSFVLCEHCADGWFAMTFSAPIETFYGSDL